MSFSIEDVWKNWEKDQPKLKKLGLNILKILKSNIYENEMYADITFRSKEIISVLKKLKKRNEKSLFNYSDLTDKLGVRIICNYQEDILPIRKIIEAQFEVKKFEDKAENLGPDKLGYTSYHYDLVHNKHSDPEINSIIFELQLRTINQHAWACTAHELSYKQDIELPKELQRKVYRLLALYEIADNELSSVNKFISGHVDFPLFVYFKKLEKKFYKLAKSAFDREQSINSLKSMLTFLGEKELKSFNSEFDSFIDTNSLKIFNIFSEIKKSPSLNYIILQPETLLIWYLLEKFEYTIRDNWAAFFDEEELNIIKSSWGVIE